MKESEVQDIQKVKKIQSCIYNKLHFLCPNGVEYKKISDIAQYRRGSFPQPYTNPQWYGGENAKPFIQVADIDKNMQLMQHTKQTISQIAQQQSVFVPHGTVIVTLQGTIGKVAITQYDAYIDRTIAIFETYKVTINKKFFAHVLYQKFAIEKKIARGGTIKTITKEEFSNFKIPIPPLEIQNEIVEILDKFNELDSNLKQELQLRKKQYEYYRDLLLDFKDIDKEYLDSIIMESNKQYSSNTISNVLESKKYPKRLKDLLFALCPYGVTHQPLKKVCIFQRGEAIVRKNTKSGCIPVIAGGRTPAYYVDIANREGKIITVAGSGVYAGFIAYWDTPIFVSDAFSLQTDEKTLLIKYVFYFLKNMQDKIFTLKSGAGIPHIYIKDLEPIKIPIPPLEIQNEIVRILDKFNELDSNLEQELQLRKKQYNYYRDLLLDFKESKDR